LSFTLQVTRYTTYQLTLWVFFNRIQSESLFGREIW